MDGTFLSDQKTYNRERFMAQYRQMKEQGDPLCGRQRQPYYQLISFFPELAYEISFVAENGGWVVSEGEDVFNGELAKDDFHAIVDHLLTPRRYRHYCRGKNSALYVETQR
ncbi:HAD hydrolase family protein [Enterobacter hormaechei]|uniref:HAD hydrolase family protein n=1 Tax=Enterobacter hormaechei TaxID=158836 RepID=UPI003F68D03A